MRSFIVTDAQAGRLPGWALLGLCALYIFPGLIGRGPWDRSDAEGFGLALTLLRGEAHDWLMPNVFAIPLADEGPLAAWFTAGVAQLTQFALGEALAIRLSVALALAAAFALTWHAALTLASRPGMQPADPFGASAARDDYARAIADAALLIVMACCGLIARAHETTAEAIQILWTAAFIWGAAIAIDRPWRGGLVLGLSIIASLFTRGIPSALMLLVCLGLLVALAPRYRLVAKPVLAATLLCMLILVPPWPLALLNQGSAGQAYLQAWLNWNRAEFGLAGAASLNWLLHTLPWYVWPAWPVAGWAIWRWRSRWNEASVALPLVLSGCVLLTALLSARTNESTVLPLVLPLSLLAAYGLPTISRAMVSLLDWIAVTTFTLFGFVLWAYWLAYLAGYPPKMAASIARLVPGYSPESHALQWLLGLTATLGWLWLVRWRIARQPRALWRPMVLSCGGLVLTWFLLMSLWLPAVESRKSYQGLAQGAIQALREHGGGAAGACVQAQGLNPALRTSFVWFGGVQFAVPGQDCPWLLTRQASSAIPADGRAWDLIWQGHRAHEPEQRMMLWRRRG